MILTEIKCKRAIQSCKNKIEHHYEHTHHKKSKAIENEYTKIKALKKQLPKKINITTSGAKEIVDGVYVFYKCPECGNKIASGFYYPPYNDILKSHEFCESCGQKIDWSDE